MTAVDFQGLSAVPATVGVLEELEESAPRPSVVFSVNGPTCPWLVRQLVRLGEFSRFWRSDERHDFLIFVTDDIHGPALYLGARQQLLILHKLV